MWKRWIGFVSGLVVALVLLWSGVLVAQFAPVWDLAFEGTPANTDLVADGDDRIRELKVSIRERMDVQHRFSDITDAFDDGLHRRNSAYAEVGGSVVHATPNCNATPITNQEDGHLCVHEPDQSLWSLNRISGAQAYERVTAIPQLAIVLWDSPIGDEDCDGVFAADECPCGFSEATEFRNLTVRGADTLPATVNVPNSAGVTCDEEYAGGLGPGCAAVGAGNPYDDNLETGELADHDHDILGETNSSGAPNWPTFRADNNVVTRTTEDEGNDDDHLHPFRTVLFCRKT